MHPTRVPQVLAVCLPHGPHHPNSSPMQIVGRPFMLSTGMPRAPKLSLTASIDRQNTSHPPTYVAIPKLARPMRTTSPHHGLYSADIVHPLANLEPQKHSWPTKTSRSLPSTSPCCHKVTSVPRLQSYNSKRLPHTCRNRLCTAQGEGHVTWQVFLQNLQEDGWL